MKPFLLLCSLLLFFSCVEQKPDLSAPQKGTLGEVHFQYPKNWAINGREEAGDFKSLFLDTSSGGLMIIKSYPIKDASPLKKMAEEFSSCSAGESKYGSIKAEKIKEEGDGFSEVFTMKLMGQSVEFQRLYMSKDLGERRLFFILQETSDVFLESKPGFDFIQSSTSLKTP